MKKLVALLIALIGIGCGHSQVPPVLHSVTWSWSAPTAANGWGGCTTSNPCTYIVSTLQVPSGTTTCPTPSTTVSYVPLNASTPTSSLSFKDSSDSGLVCAVLQTAQSGAISNPSVPSNVVTVLANPLPPTISGTAAMLEKQKKEQEALAKYNHNSFMRAPMPQATR